MGMDVSLSLPEIDAPVRQLHASLERSNANWETEVRGDRYRGKSRPEHEHGIIAGALAIIKELVDATGHTVEFPEPPDGGWRVALSWVPKP